MYKLGAKFSKRSIEDVKHDILAARQLNDQPDEMAGASDFNVLGSCFSAAEYQHSQMLIQTIQQSHEPADECFNQPETTITDEENPTDDFPYSMVYAVA